MSVTKQIADHFRQVHFGGNWTSVNLKESLSDIDWQLATRKVQSLNSIAALVFHINYYLSEVLKVLKGEPLTHTTNLALLTLQSIRKSIGINY